MARIKFPNTFEKQRELLSLIRAKHIVDGTNSVLISFLIQSKINLDADFTSGNAAETHNANQKFSMLLAEKYKQSRDVKFDSVFSHMRGAIQVLKFLYKPNVRKLGDWGAEVNNKSKIKYSSVFENKVKLFREIKLKHDSFPLGANPLAAYLSYHNINMNDFADHVTDAENFQKENKTARRKAEQATQERNKLWIPVTKNMRHISTFLKQLFTGNEKKLGEWGFVIDSPKRTAKERLCKLKAGKKITISKIKIESTVTNLSNADLYIYKGINLSRGFLIVRANEGAKLTKGFSRITVFNQSTIENARFSVTTYR